MNRHGETEPHECWTLVQLRNLRDHAVLVSDIYRHLRPLGKGVVEAGLIVYGGFAGLDVLEQVIALLMHT